MRVAVGAVVEEMPPLVDCTDAMHSLGDTNKKLKAMVEAAKRDGRPVPKYMQALYDNPMYGFGSNMSPEVFKTSSKRPILMLMRRCLGARRTMRRLQILMRRLQILRSSCKSRAILWKRGIPEGFFSSQCAIG